jgi:hypothetical protein
MTPSAVTPAGRGARTKAPNGRGTATGPAPGQGGARKAPSGRRATASAPARHGGGTKAPSGRGAAAQTRTAGHRSKVRHETTPNAPRRVSGPLSGLRRGPAVPRTAPRRGAARGSAAQAPAGRGLAASAVAFARALPDHAVLDRLIRGRAWIPILGVLLAGIVAMQVEVLKLGTSMGRSLERTTALQSRNELLQASVASLADDQRIERLAAGMGMVMPDPDAVNFLAAGPVGNLKQVIASIHEPDASAFTAQLPLSSTPADAATPGVTPLDTAAVPATSIAAPDSSTSATSTGVSDTGPSAAVAPTSTSTDQAASSSGGAPAPTGG